MKKITRSELINLLTEIEFQRIDDFELEEMIKNGYVGYNNFNDNQLMWEYVNIFEEGIEIVSEVDKANKHKF